MKGSSAAGASLTFVVLATALFMAVAGDASSCHNNVPKMTWSEACRNISRPEAPYNLCQETLKHAPAEGSTAVTLFALEAAKVAWQSYAGTEAKAKDLVRHGSLPGGERRACERCMEYYTVALDRMAAVIEDLNICKFRGTVSKYGDANDFVVACAFELWEFQNSPLVAMNAADGHLTKVAVDLGRLVLDHQPLSRG